MKARKHAVTPTDRGPRPDKDGIFPAATWRQSNPGYDSTPSKQPSNPRLATVDGGLMWDIEQQGRKA